MRISKPDNYQAPEYSLVKIQGCSAQALGFTLLSEVGEVAARRYCNKVLVHECATVDLPGPIELDKAEFIATSDPCYKYFEVFKSSDTVGVFPSTITLTTNVGGETTNITVSFDGSETSCLPLAMAYRLYIYPTSTGIRELAAQGQLFISPCGNTEDCDKELWTDVQW